ncbi:hypothetical protein V8C43DRAFT_288282 [Trichoderma afarasin]
MANSNFLETITSPEEANVDIIAVHGMNPNNNEQHADNAWTHPVTKVNWLRDLLPLRIPNARIFAYKYNANIAFGKSVAGISEQAKNLLQCMVQDRQANGTRPIIFIAHSMGGIIVKEALVTAFFNEQAYPTIWTFTHSIAFFGVPHGGSQHAAWVKSISRIMALSPAKLNSSFIESIAADSAYNKDLNNKFKDLFGAYKILSFCETLPHGDVSLGLVVDMDAAILGWPDDLEVKIYMNRDHVGICKFANAEEPEWEQVSNALYHAALSAVGPNEASLSRQQAIQGAQDVLAGLGNGSSNTNGLHDIQRNVFLLKAAILGLASWFLPFLPVILLGFASFMLPSVGTLMAKANEVKQSQERLVTLHREGIQTLDPQLATVLQAATQLTPFQNEVPLTNIHTGEAHPLRIWNLQLELDRFASPIKRDLITHHTAYNRAKGDLALMEDALRAAEGKKDTEIMAMWSERFQQERTRREEEEEEADGGCCVIL